MSAHREDLIEFGRSFAALSEATVDQMEATFLDLDADDLDVDDLAAGLEFWQWAGAFNPDWQLAAREASVDLMAAIDKIGATS